MIISVGKLNDRWLRTQLPTRFKAHSLHKPEHVRPLSTLVNTPSSPLKRSISSVRIYSSYGLALLQRYQSSVYGHAREEIREMKTIVSRLKSLVLLWLRRLSPTLAAVCIVALAAWAGTNSPIDTTGGSPAVTTLPVAGTPPNDAALSTGGSSGTAPNGGAYVTSAPPSSSAAQDSRGGNITSTTCDRPQTTASTSQSQSSSPSQSSSEPSSTSDSDTNQPQATDPVNQLTAALTDITKPVTELL